MAKKSLPRFNLHEALNKKSFDHAVICTFTFDPVFFEQYCLEKFRSLSNNGNITVFTDKTIYEQVLLGPESTRPKSANLRYLLFPVSVPGVFHPKIFLFASKNRGKLFIGSANFTRSGLTSNAEMIASFDYETEKDERHIHVFQKTFKYLLELGSRLNSRNVDSNLQEIACKADWLVQDQEIIESESVLFLNNLTEPLWKQIVTDIEPPVESISILSRYFDSQPGFLDVVENDLNPTRIQIYTQNGVTNLTPQWLDHPLVRNGRAEIFLCNYLDDGFLQHLHAKAIAIQKGNNISLVYGSANFTSSALLRTSTAGNMEVLIKLPEITTSNLKPSQLFDPEKSAIRLTDGSILQNSPSDEEDLINERTTFQIKLYEAEVRPEDGEEVMVIRAEIPVGLRFEALQCRFTFSDQASCVSTLRHKQDYYYFSSINEGIRRRLNEGSTILAIESFVENNWATLSNSILVTNLKDIKTDNPVRRERLVREAQQSSAQFFSVLRELLESGDQQTLLTFLNFCDIPLNSHPRPRLADNSRPVWDGGEVMRKLGDRNLKIYIELHLAAVAFFDRHLRKLRRHVEDRALHGIENFLHIFLAMGGILSSQADRVVSGIESKSSNLSTAEWAECRNHIDIYFSKFKELMTCLWGEYLSSLTREYSHNELSEKFLPDLESINNLSSKMLACRARVEAVRTRHLIRRDYSGRTITPGYFHCVFAEDKWERYTEEITTSLRNVQKSVRSVA
jgi:HKD family nuclease